MAAARRESYFNGNIQSRYQRNVGGEAKRNVQSLAGVAKMAESCGLMK